MDDLFERVARRLKASYSAGSMNTYEVILAALHSRFGDDEIALREYVQSLLDTIASMTGDPVTFEEFIDGQTTPGNTH